MLSCLYEPPLWYINVLEISVIFSWFWQASCINHLVIYEKALWCFSKCACFDRDKLQVWIQDQVMRKIDGWWLYIMIVSFIGLGIPSIWRNSQTLPQDIDKLFHIKSYRVRIAMMTNIIYTQLVFLWSDCFILSYLLNLIPISATCNFVLKVGSWLIKLSFHHRGWPKFITHLI